MVNALLGYINHFIASMNIMLVTSHYSGIMIIVLCYLPYNTEIISMKL